MSRARRLSRFVDRDMTARGSPASANNLSLLIALVPLAPLALLARPYSAWEWAVAAVSITACAAWVGFVLWRAYRRLLAVGARGDRDFDRSTKHLLGPEYRATESATAARRRRRSSRPPGR